MMKLKKTFQIKIVFSSKKFIIKITGIKHERKGNWRVTIMFLDFEHKSRWMREKWKGKNKLN
jgi:hypothetical protein